MNFRDAEPRYAPTATAKPFFTSVVSMRREEEGYEDALTVPWTVRLSIARSGVVAEIKVRVPHGAYDEAGIVAVARAKLHEFSSALAVETQPWAATEEELRERYPAPPKSP